MLKYTNAQMSIADLFLLFWLQVPARNKLELDIRVKAGQVVEWQARVADKVRSNCNCSSSFAGILRVNWVLPVFFVGFGVVVGVVFSSLAAGKSHTKR